MACIGFYWTASAAQVVLIGLVVLAGESSVLGHRPSILGTLLSAIDPRPSALDQFGKFSEVQALLLGVGFEAIEREGDVEFLHVHPPVIVYG